MATKDKHICLRKPYVFEINEHLMLDTHIQLIRSEFCFE